MSILDTWSRNETLPERYKTMNVNEMEKRMREIKESMGEKLLILGHHYQKEEVYQFADFAGDSLELAQIAAKNREAETIVFCGVHFMAETADILTEKDQIVILPDMRAGCSMADMANMEQTRRAWTELMHLFGDTIIPLTYVNSTADIKAFVGEHGGATVTSSNAKKMVQWAFGQKERILFLPDQHLGRNTAYDLGIPLTQMAIWDPIGHKLEALCPLEDIKVILWKGHCSVHENFTVQNVHDIRKTYPEMNVIVHPECHHEVVAISDYAGSTKYIIDTINKAAPGTAWAIGTEMNLVNRLKQNHPDKTILSLNPHMCPCLTMNRIDLPHLLWALENVEKGKIVNQITVNQQTSHEAIRALERMLQHI
ncbi:quinolinate synthase NadA [Priestia koreensis]|uniref:quinolinate synthase NadA n=1 Tax=Priestia koreensis TaxID=284581 RepID=UPI00203CB4B7|nr:quinolinate synthase NadA [Priestia koreensis]MCM3002627.1 quinolinate synthase NadA [Priestia koreensis]